MGDVGGKAGREDRAFSRQFIENRKSMTLEGVFVVD